MKTLKWVGRTLFLEPLAIRIVMMVTLLFAAIPPVHTVIGPYVKILLAWGAVVLLTDVFTRRRSLRNRYAGFLLLFMVAYAASIWVNRAAGLSDNLSEFLYAIVFFFVLFAYDTDDSPEKAARDVRVLARVFVVVTALFALACMTTFLFSINYKYVEQTTPQYTTEVVIGVSVNRLFGLYNPNTGSMLNLMSTVFSLLLLLTGSTRWTARVAHGLNLALQYICLILTLSRTAWFMLAVFWALFVFFVMPRRWKRHPRLAELGRVGMAVVAAALVLLLSVPVKAVMAYAPAAVQSVIDDEPDASSSSEKEEPAAEAEASGEDSKPQTKVDITRTDDKTVGGLLTGRQYLWKGGWLAFLDHPLFGTGHAGLYEAVKDYIPAYWHHNVLRGGMHNMAVMVLACSGGVGFVLMLVFVLFSGGRALKWMWRRRGDRAAALCNTLTVLLLTMLGAEMFESRLLYTVTIFGVVFWTMYGYAMRLVDAYEPEKAARSGAYNRLTRLVQRKSDGKGRTA